MGQWKLAYMPLFLVLDTRWSCVVILTHQPPYLRESASDGYWIGGSMDHKAGLNEVDKRTGNLTPIF
jgi:hypothetical protein